MPCKPDRPSLVIAPTARPMAPPSLRRRVIILFEPLRGWHISIPKRGLPSSLLSHWSPRHCLAIASVRLNRVLQVT